MCVILVLWPQLLLGSSGREGLNFRLPPLTPPGQPSPHSLLTSLVRDKEVCLGVGVENWELPQSQTERKGKSQEESQWVRVTVPAVITWQDVDLSASHSTQKHFSTLLVLVFGVVGPDNPVQSVRVRVCVCVCACVCVYRGQWTFRPSR